MTNSIVNAGTITGSGNIMGNAGATFSRTLSISTVNLNDVGYDAEFTNNTMFFNNSFPPYLTDYMPESTPLLITVSGLIGDSIAMNGQTFTVMRVNQTIVDVSGFAAFISTHGLNGTHAYEKYDHTWNWNS
jgi:hypothetical protein